MITIRMKMKTHPILLAGLVLLGGLHPKAQAAVLTVTAFQPTNNTGGGNIYAPAFDAQPLTEPVDGSAGLTTGAGYSFFVTGRWAGIDFGVDYLDISITDIFILQGSYGNPNGVAQYFWSADTTWEEADVAAPDFHFLNYTGNNSGGGADTGRWTNIYSNPAGVTPDGRYLIFQYVSGNEGNFKYEMAFVGGIVPEPGAVFLVIGGVAGLGLGRRRHSLRIAADRPEWRRPRGD